MQRPVRGKAVARYVAGVDVRGEVIMQSETPDIEAEPGASNRTRTRLPVMPSPGRRALRSLLLALCASSIASSAFAQPLPVPATYPILQATMTTHAIDRRVVTSSDGTRYQIFRAVPQDAPPTEGYPVLTLLDGNAVFDQLTPQMLERVPGLVLVGIGTETEERFDTRRRSLDYTPPLSADGPVPDPERPGGEVGGADRFLARLTGELRETAEAGLPVDPARRTLWGHSYGGLFALYTLLTRPDAFSRFAAISPSVDWGGGVLGRIEAEAPQEEGRRLRLLLAYGDSERRRGIGPDGKPVAAPKGPHPEGMRSKAAFAERLRRRAGLEIDERVLKGLGHGETLPASLPLALDLAAR